MTELRTIALGDLVPHPDNPRLQLREDVVERLAAEIGRTGFGQEHALLVRPIDGKWQILSGHHRVEAANRAGLDAAPCWVRQLDDTEAFMQLVLSNTQGELSPLEIGMHALKAVPLAQGKSGAGLTSYADRLGRNQESVRQLRKAAEVATSLSNISWKVDLAEKPSHLYEISKAPRFAWAVLVGHLIKKSWTVAETKSTVDKVRQFDIAETDTGWLPLADVVARFLASGKPGPAAVEQLAADVHRVLDAIDTDGTQEDAATFRAWLIEHQGRESWDRRAISNYHAALIREWAERAAAAVQAAAEEEEGPKLPDGVTLLHGDLREVLADVEPGTVDSIITDPPYPAEFLPLFADLAALAARVLKPGGLLAVMVGQSYLPDIFKLLDHDGLNWHWPISYGTPGGQAVQLWQRKVNTFWKPVLLYTKGEYTGPWIGDVAKSDVNDNDKRHHHWGQSESGMADLIERLTRPGDLICDPFLGGGTTAVVAHALGRRFVGCDIDQDCVDATVARFDKEPAA